VNITSRAASPANLLPCRVRLRLGCWSCMVERVGPRTTSASSFVDWDLLDPRASGRRRTVASEADVAFLADGQGLPADNGVGLPWKR
jgi:hypothetical protein